jgi:FAD/FMN-containing dehydrogenase/Fe-S oxidoreductase
LPGEVSSSLAQRGAFSTDNSVYRIVPALVVAPRDAGDVETLLKAADEEPFRSLSLTGRGGGTGTNGQALNDGIIVDFRRQMNRILEINLEEGWADVEPGLVLDDLNSSLASHGVFFAPTTSTANRCTIGGMVSTDASGKGSRIYGKTGDNLLGLDLVLSGGQSLRFDETPPDWSHPMLSEIEAACDAGREPLLARVPRLSRRFTGFDLEMARPDKRTLCWWRLAVGAEGTLGLITRIRVKLTKKPAHNRLGVIAVERFIDALDATERLLAFDPLAIEVMDEWVQRLAREGGLLDDVPKSLTGQGDTVLVFIEFAGNDASKVDEQMAACLRAAAELPGFVAAHAASKPSDIAHLWSVRSGAVGLLGAAEGRRKPIAFVEDCVVPPERLSEFVAAFRQILDEHGLAYGIYGHADVGCLHVRPALDIDDAQDRERFKAVSDAVFAAATAHGGIFWGEHGKGIRGDYLEAFVGEDVFRAFCRIKTAFDPGHRLNPGKLYVAQTERLSVSGAPFRTVRPKNGARYSQAFDCNGNALCLSYSASVPMCPSFKVSAELRHSPKGRAEALKALEEARLSGAAVSDLEDDVFDAMAGCLGCKSCASACPMHIDIPELRSQFLETYYATRRRPLADSAVAALERFSPYLARLRSPWRLISATRFYRSVGEALGLVDLPPPAPAEPLRNLPIVSAERLESLAGTDTVALVQDPFTTLFGTNAILDVANGLGALGFRPVLLPLVPAGKALHVKGYRKAFRSRAEAFAQMLGRAGKSGVPLVGVDPALIYMLRSEYKAAGKTPASKVQSPEEFLLAQIEKGRIAPVRSSDTQALSLFLHCTEKTLRPHAARDWTRVFDHLGIPAKVVATGCCGMSGLFGHERRNQEWSRKLYDMSWRKPVEEASAVAATGFSCRCQVERFGQKAPRHPMAFIAALEAAGTLVDPTSSAASNEL